MIATDMERRITHWNRAAEELYGFGRDDVLGKRFPECVGAEAPTSDDGRHPYLERHSEWLELRRRGGDEQRVEIEVHPMLIGDREPAGFTLVSWPEGDDHRGPEAARHAERTLRAILDACPIPIIGVDREGTILVWTPAAERLFGWSAEEVVDGGVNPLIPEELEGQFGETFGRLMEGETVKDLHTWRVTKRGTRIEVNLHASPLRDPNGRIVGALALVTDLSERSHLRDQLRLAQRMEPMGRLAGGVAHDFNNVLTGIAGLAELVLSRLDPDDPVRDDVEEIERAVHRATDLTGKLLSFSRQRVLQPRVVDVSRLVYEMEALLHRVLPETVELQTHLDERGDCTVEADVGGLEQVLMNLAVNARDAMPAGGRIGISVTNTVIDEDQAASYSYPVRTGEFVELSVEDSGMGMDEETLAQIFEPFFTTKEKGKGTGLGLSTAYGIVKQSGGYLWVTSTVGMGSRFRVLLPRVHEKPAKPKVVKPTGDLRGSETILLVEDEAQVRSLVQRILEDKGYNVLVARNGAEALGMFKTMEETVDLVVSDVVMPRLGGRELVRILREDHPGLPALYISGYTDDPDLRAGKLGEEEHFLEKPFTARRLTRVIREILDGAGGSAPDRSG